MLRGGKVPSSNFASRLKWVWIFYFDGLLYQLISLSSLASPRLLGRAKSGRDTYTRTTWLHETGEADFIESKARLCATAGLYWCMYNPRDGAEVWGVELVEIRRSTMTLELGCEGLRLSRLSAFYNDR